MNWLLFATGLLLQKAPVEILLHIDGEPGTRFQAVCTVVNAHATQQIDLIQQVPWQGRWAAEQLRCTLTQLNQGALKVSARYSGNSSRQYSTGAGSRLQLQIEG